ncbi:MAG: phosphate ABC transporter permease PstA [Acidobacteriota bacterium]
MSQTPDPSVPASGASSDDAASWKKRRPRARTSLFAAGEPMVWLTGGALIICLVMVVGLLSLVLYQGLSTFWPQPVIKVETPRGPFMGEITRINEYVPRADAFSDLPTEWQAKVADAVEMSSYGEIRRRLMRTGNFRLTQNHFSWIEDPIVEREERPAWAMVVERMEWGRFYGELEAFAYVVMLESGGDLDALIAEQSGSGALRLVVETNQGMTVAPLAERAQHGSDIVGVARLETDLETAWADYHDYHDEVRARWEKRRHLEKHDTGEINHRQEQARLTVRKAEIALDGARADRNEDAIARAESALADAQAAFEQVRAEGNEAFTEIRGQIDQINRENSRYQVLFLTAGEGALPPRLALLRLDEIVSAYPANRIGFGGKLGVYIERWGEFLTAEPREANSEGGIYPAIFGTVAMTLIMAIAVVPFGVLAALYLREYAKAGPVVSAVRIAVNNLAGVPSIVFGVFGLGFFCYVVGVSIDELFFEARLPNPTYGKGGLLWASFTLALLTLPVVIVATEEAVAAVPNSMREGSYACGASKWQTIHRIVLPRALPGIITGMILAIARGAGEVAPLMLVGAVKLAPELPIDGVFPYIHPERSFMHLGFHIYDVGFQSQNSEAAKPMVFTTTFVLITIVATLNLATIWLRSRLRKRFAGGQF